MTQQGKSSMQQNPNLLGGNYQYWKDRTTGSFYISKGNDTNRLSGPFTSMSEIPSRPLQDTDFQSGHGVSVNSLEQVTESQIQKELAGVSSS